MFKLLIILFSMLFSYQHVSSFIPFKVEGVVRDKTSLRGINGVHVYAVKGEEEAITDAEGNFSFQTWRKEIQLTAEAREYKKYAVRLTLPVVRHSILLVKEAK